MSNALSDRMSDPVQATSRRAPTMRDRFYTFYVYGVLWLAVIVYVGIFGLPLLVLAYTIDRQRKRARQLARFIFTALVRHLCVVRGGRWVVDNAPFDWGTIGPCIVVANHSSCMDSVVLMGLPAGVGDGRIWSKGWPFRVPLLGWLMRLSGHLFVEDFNILPDAQSCLADGISLLVFPESSRTRTGKVGRFRDGAFLLAQRTGRPIVPVAIHGAFRCFPPGQPWMFGPPLRVQPLGVLYPAADATGQLKGHADLKREARRMISTALGEARRSETVDDSQQAAA